MRQKISLMTSVSAAFTGGKSSSTNQDTGVATGFPFWIDYAGKLREIYVTDSQLVLKATGLNEFLVHVVFKLPANPAISSGIVSLDQSHCIACQS